MIEDKLKQHIGKGEPFRVPEGYFDSFAERLQARIDQMPKVEKPTRRFQLVPKAWFAAAASIVIVASVGLSVMIHKGGSKIGEPEAPVVAAGPELAKASESSTMSSDEAAYYYEELDYAMIDDNEIAYYLTEY